jgi:arsenate reductase
MRFYHNPRCSKSRQALALLEERGVEVEVVRYLETGVLEDDLVILARLENIVRKKEAGPEAMAALHGPEDIIVLLRNHPKALERPILIANGKAVIGRPPENVLNLLTDA